jgi:hypothetical protein
LRAWTSDADGWNAWGRRLMRLTLRRLFNRLVGLIPPFLMRGFMKVFVSHPEFAERAGFQVYPRVFYSPLPDPAEVDVARLREKRSLPGIDLRVDAALRLLVELVRYSGELDQFPRHQHSGSIAWDHTYPSLDSAALYTMIRHLKPKRYIEVGCGWSSRVSSAALARNQAEGFACQSVFIEPFPSLHLKEVKLPGQFLEQKVQQVPLETFEKLAANDLLFIDTSHVLKVQNDVEYELLHVLPSLQAGVYVHIHDIFTPYDYPGEWLVAGVNRGGVNEQYALECLLSGGRFWEVILPVHLLWREHTASLDQLFPGTKERPAAFYLRKSRS